MANMREIRGRIKGVKSTQQITKAMKMVSVSKLRKTQTGMNAMRLFAEQCQQVMYDLLGSGVSFDHPLLTPHKDVNNVTYVVVVGNRGLCGAYNTNLIRYLEQLLAQETRPCQVVVIGRWTSENLARLPVLQTFDQFPDTPGPEDCTQITQYLRQLYLSGQSDEIRVVYQHFVNVITQIPQQRQLLPAALPVEAADAQPADYRFEPSRQEIMAKTVELYLSSTVYQILLEARSGEHSARTTAMGAAADNTEELIAELSLELNRARQAQITTEISEIAGGASALKQNKH